MTEAHDIRVHVETQFIDEQSDPEADRYVFAYTIAIENHGSMQAQLLNRHWVITDASGKVQEVRGAGVVGEQPVLQPGERLEYTSGAVLETPVGSMQGSYEMIAADGEHFDAPIAAFTLSIPNILH